MATLNTQNTFNQAFGNSATCGLTGVLAGDTLVLVLRDRDGGQPSGVSDDINGAWSATPIVISNTHNLIGIWVKHNSGSGNPTVTISYGGNSVFGGNVSAYSPAGGTISTGNSAGAAGTATTIHTPGSIVASAGVMVRGVQISSDVSGTWGDSFTALSNPEKIRIAYKLTTGETADGDWTTVGNENTDNVIVGFTETPPPTGGALAGGSFPLGRIMRPRPFAPGLAR